MVEEEEEEEWPRSGKHGKMEREAAGESEGEGDSESTKNASESKYEQSPVPKRSASKLKFTLQPSQTTFTREQLSSACL